MKYFLLACAILVSTSGFVHAGSKAPRRTVKKPVSTCKDGKCSLSQPVTNCKDGKCFLKR